MSFNARLAATVAARGMLCVGLDPIYAELPARFQTGEVEQAFLAVNRWLADATAPAAAAFKLQMKVYTAEGPAGWAALIATCRYLKATYPDHLLILDAKYGDVSHVLARSAHEAFTLCRADAVTAFAHPGRLGLAPLLADPERGCFVVCRTSNPGATEMQDIPTVGGEPYFLALARQVAAHWNAAANCGLVVGATYPAEMTTVRQAVPDLPLLVPGVGAQGGDLAASVQAGRDAAGGGLLISASRSLMMADDPGTLAADLHRQIALAQQAAPGPGADGDPAVAGLIVELFDKGHIQFKPVQLKSGRLSPYYLNMRGLAADPPLFGRVCRAFAAAAGRMGLDYDILLGIAYAGIPLAVGVGGVLGRPAGYVRAEAKGYGTRQMVEGPAPGARALLLDDVISDGASKLDVLEPLAAAQVGVAGILVFIDRGQGGVEAVRAAGLRAEAVTTMPAALRALRAADRITDAQVAAAEAFMRGD
jgi:orotidine 5'-phosphate decarboxylase subfamily 2